VTAVLGHRGKRTAGADVSLFPHSSSRPVLSLPLFSPVLAWVQSAPLPRGLIHICSSQLQPNCCLGSVNLGEPSLRRPRGPSGPGSCLRTLRCPSLTATHHSFVRPQYLVRLRSQDTILRPFSITVLFFGVTPYLFWLPPALLIKLEFHGPLFVRPLVTSVALIFFGYCYAC